MSIQDNPLLQFDSLPAFDAIQADHIQPAVEHVLAQNRRRLDTLLEEEAGQNQADWDRLMKPLEEMDDRLDKVWSTASHLNGVNNTPDIRAAYQACQPMITDYYSELGQNTALYRALKRLQDAADGLDLSGAQKKVLKDTVLDFELAGVSLADAQKKQFAELQNRLSTLSNEFGNNVLDATMAWSAHITDRAELAGVPEMTIEAAAEAARRKQQDGYLLTLDFPCYFAVMNNADNAALRERMHTAFVTRASDQDESGGKWDNSALMIEILACRQEMAQLLGYSNYAEVSVARKMARSVQEVNDFLDDLIKYSRPAAEKDFAELQMFAREHYAVETLNPWDVAYYSEKLRKQRFDISQEELRAYFPLERVRQGLFTVAERLFGISIEPAVTSTWHPLVEFYDIRRDGEIIARFYFDLFTREGKRGGAWMADSRGRRMLATAQWQIPVAYLVCNFAPPGDNTPSLLTHNDVTTLFHEFGHGLHHMLTREQYLRCSGINGVAWDAVELPSQLLENWCWEPDALPLISGHYKTGEALPAAMLEKMLAARNFQSGMQSVRQLEFALFDFSLHQQAVKKDPGFIPGVLQAARERTAVVPVSPRNRFENSFSHIFAGGYAAGYYSYKWAEVLSADVFSRFRETGVFNADTGEAFLDKLLSRGGGAEALELFTDFMGREPELKALLLQEGLVNETVLSKH